MIINSIPKKDGFFMPAEYDRHSGTIIIWPERGGSWIYGGGAARSTFSRVIRAIAESETVYVAVSQKGKHSAEELLSEQIQSGKVVLWNIPTDDSWARDVAPTFVTDGETVRGIDWRFNAWGGEFDGLYSKWDKDDAFALSACCALGLDSYSARPFVLEGGSIHSNGKGTVITTEECLLSKGRNPKMTKSEIEIKLKEYLDCNRVIWLPYGVVGDETNGHVDNICAFVSENTVVLGWEEYGEQNKRCEANLKELENNGINVIKIPFPEKPVTITEYESKGYDYEEGEAQREVGEKLAASYINFYICNSAVIVPQFGDKNDKIALDILADAFKDRKIVPIFARDIIVGGGNIHCITQQIPAKGIKR